MYGALLTSHQAATKVSIWYMHNFAVYIIHCNCASVSPLSFAKAPLQHSSGSFRPLQTSYCKSECIIVGPVRDHGILSCHVHVIHVLPYFYSYGFLTHMISSSFRIMTLTHGAITTMVRSEGQTANPAFQPILQLIQVKAVGNDRFRVRTPVRHFRLLQIPLSLTIPTGYSFRWTTLCAGHVGHTAGWPRAQWTAQRQLNCPSRRFHD